MIRVQVLYEFGDVVNIDEVAAEHVNVRSVRGRRATVKLAEEEVHYFGVARIFIERDYDGPAFPFTRRTVADR